MTGVLVTSYCFQLVASYTTKEQKAYARAGSIAEEVISCIRTVASFGGEDKEAHRQEWGHQFALFNDVMYCV